MRPVVWQTPFWFGCHGCFGYVGWYAHRVMVGIYLTEFDSRSWLAHCTRFVNDILLSAPSIVIGLFVYAVVVVQLKSFSGFAGVVALSLLVIPVAIRTTENMLQLVPPAWPA